MLAATAIAIFIIPVTFYLVERLTLRVSTKARRKRDERGQGQQKEH